MAINNEQDLEAKFRDRALLRSGERYFDVSSALDFIEACAGYDCAIIGIEGAEISPEGTTPRMDLIADFSRLTVDSWDQFKQRTTEEANEFLRRIGVGDVGVYLNVIVFTKLDWARKNTGRE